MRARAALLCSFLSVSACVEADIVDCGTGFEFVVGGAVSCAYCDGDLPAVCPRADWNRSVEGAVGYCTPSDDPLAPEFAALACERCGPRAPVGEITALATGDDHACAIIGGQLYCWGLNEFGQIGVPLSVERCDYPSRVGERSRRFGALGVGSDHTCAQEEDNALYCFGNNDTSQLGRVMDGDSIDVPTLDASGPAPQPFSIRLDAITGGTNFTCAAGAGQLFCWGRGNVVDSDAPRTLPAPPPNAAWIAAREASVCVGSTTETVCWGANMNGEASGGSGAVAYADRRSVGGLTAPLSAIGTGAFSSCAVADGMLSCWGDNVMGVLGTGTVGGAIVADPVAVTLGAERADGVCVGRGHACALSAGEVRCWGDGLNGQLGDGLVTSSASPRLVEGLTMVEALACGADHTCARTNDDRILCWGDNETGVIGDRETLVARPVQVFP